MKKNKLFQCVTFSACLLGTLLIATAVEAKGHGKVIGKFVLKGELPEVKNLKDKNDPSVKDKICVVKDIKSKALVIDEKSKGIKNIIIYIKKVKSKDIHPELAKSAKEVIDYDQVGCMFKPHILLVRTDQKVRVLSADNCSHNFHTHPIRQEGVNFTVTPNDRKGTKIEMKASESLPTKVNCDIHTWMKGYWLVLDHPYSVITKADGSFEIDLVPEGKQEFIVWHENPGYIKAGKKGSRKGFKVKIKDGETYDLGTIELTADDLKAKK